jgi:hypothetical protein
VTTGSLPAYLHWQEATRALICGADQLRDFQDRRYSYAAEVGRLLTQPGSDGRPLDGPVLYGVLSDGAGLLYVGQSADARRRLRDLAVGESHHLATTVPPEAWDRVVVVRWPDLLPELRRSDRDAITNLPTVVTGEGLERLLQAELKPVLNSRRRTPAGGWSPRDVARSRSRGGAVAQVLAPLHGLVLPLWQQLATTPVKGDHYYERLGRAVLPTRLPLAVVGSGPQGVG